MPDCIRWEADGFELVIDTPPDDYPSIRHLGARGAGPAARTETAIPLVELRTDGDAGSLATSQRLMGGRQSRRLRAEGHEADERTLTLFSRDPQTGLRVTTRFEAGAGAPVLRVSSEVRNDGAEPVVLRAVSSLALGGLGTPGASWWSDRVSFAHNSWFREASWRTQTLAELGVDDVGLRRWGYRASRALFALSSTGTWSTGGHLPMGVLESHDRDRALAWQIEHSGPWRWEVGDYGDSTYLVASGPTDSFHGWSEVLRPGETFTTVPVSLAVATDAGAAFAALTESRRAHRRPHPDHEALPIVFNDFMNGLMGDPTTDRLLPLVTAAARAGAECFCIDAGWYADDGEWWDGVGEWLPSQRRFPGGLGQVIQAIRDEGMVPGLWLEPEVVGIRSPLATRLPDAAFFQRDGARVIEAARYQLDFRHPATLAHLDAVVDRLVDEFGIGYLKLDYNIDVLTGTDLDADSPGAGQLGHARAYLAWIGRVLDRHPGLVLENCASGGQRMDQALLALHQLQSVSDNQDPLHTAAIAASAPTAVTPEQAAVWAFPQHGWSAELIAFTVVNSLLGRVHLSGRIDLLDEDEARLVADGMRVYRDIRHLLARGRPFWPLGLPGWHDDWLALGIAGEDETLLTVWRRGGDTRIVLPLRGELGLGGPALDRPAPDAPTAWRADVLYPPPAAHPTAWEWEAPGRLAIELPAEPSARLLRLRPSSAGQGRD